MIALAAVVLLQVGGFPPLKQEVIDAGPSGRFYVEDGALKWRAQCSAPILIGKSDAQSSDEWKVYDSCVAKQAIDDLRYSGEVISLGIRLGRLLAQTRSAAEKSAH